MNKQAILRGWVGTFAKYLVIGLIILSETRLSAADYTSPGLGSYLVDPRDLELEDVEIASESPLPNGRVLLEVTGTIQNTDVGIWAGVGAGVSDGIQTEDYQLLSATVRQEVLVGVGQSATNFGVISVIVVAADVASAVTEIESGTVLNVWGETISGEFIDEASELPLENIEVLEQHVLSNGRVLLQVGAAVRNETDQILEEVAIGFVSTAGTVSYTTPRASMDFSAVPANGEVSALEPLYLDVAGDEVEQVRANLLSGAGLQVFGTELWVFALPPRGIDQETESAWRPPAESAGGDDLKLVFTNVTTLLESIQPGDLLLEDPSLNLLALAIDNPADPFDDDEKMLGDYLPFEVSTVTVLSNEVHVVGQKKLLGQILVSGTFVAYAIDAYDRPVRDPYNPALENTYTEEEQDERDEVAMMLAEEDPRDGRLADLKGLIALPWHFNETFLTDRVKVSGELFFRQSGLKFELKIRNFQVQRAVTRIDAGAVLNMVVEVDGEKKDSSEPQEEEPDEGSKNLLPIDLLPGVTFNIAGVQVTVQPELTLTAGVEANVPKSLTVPLQSSFLVGMEMGFDRSRMTETDDGFFYEPFTETHPLRVSEPTVFDELAATLGAWAELELGVKIGAGEGVLLRAGPSLAVRLENNFSLAPLSNPWWEIDSGVDLIGRFSMDVDFLGLATIDLVDAEASIHHFDIFHRDAGGPLVGGLSAASVGNESVTEPVIGNNARWARMFQPRPGSGLGNAFAIPLPGNEVVVGGSVGVSGADAMVAKFSAEGELIWMNDTYGLGGPTMQRGASLPDGTFVTAGTRGFDVVLSYYNPDGSRNWAYAYTPNPILTVKGVAATTNRTGQAEFYVTGFMNHQTVRHSDPVLIKFDSEGSVLWAVYYEMEGDDESHGITISADGNPILCGYTDADVAPPAHGTADPGNLLKNIVSSGLLMKVDGETGSVIWAQAVASRWGMVFETVIEAPDGTVYAGGAAGKIVTQDRPCNLFAKFTPDGSLLNHVLVGDDPDWVDELLNGGSTPYDLVTSLIWTPEGLVACGNTGLGEDRAAWVMGLTEEFGVKFYSVFDGDLAEVLFGVVDAGDGLGVFGSSRSAYPLGEGGESIGMLMKLPWEGILRFHEDTGMRSLFLQPRIYNSAGTEEFQILSSVEIPNAPPMRFGNTDSRITVSSNVPITLTASAEVRPLNPSTTPLVVGLEKLDESLVNDFESWTDYHQLPTDTLPDGDHDGDGTSNILESYFGQNPWAEDSAPFTLTYSSLNGEPTVLIEFERQNFAQEYTAYFEASEDLETWVPAPGVTEIILSVGTVSDLV